MTSLGWIGLGQMGSPMAANLLKNGFKVTLWNRSVDKTDPLREMGAVVASSPCELAEGTEIIFLMLSDGKAGKEVLRGEKGILKSDLTGKIVVNMSTIAPEESLEMAKSVSGRGGEYLDAPVSGSVGAAVGAALLILAGGSGKALDKCRPYLDVLGRKIIHFGDVGKGNSAKLAINLLLGITAQGIAETMLLGEVSGLEKELVAEMISSSGMNTPFFQAKKEMIFSEQFPPAFKTELMSKDLGLAVRQAEAQGLSLTLGNATDRTYQNAMGHDKASLDMASIYLELKENNIKENK